MQIDLGGLKGEAFAKERFLNIFEKKSHMLTKIENKVLWNIIKI